MLETALAKLLVLRCYNEFRKHPPDDEVDDQDQEMYIRRVRRQRTKEMASEEEVRVWGLGRKARKEKRRQRGCGPDGPSISARRR